MESDSTRTTSREYPGIHLMPFYLYQNKDDVVLVSAENEQEALFIVGCEIRWTDDDMCLTELNEISDGVIFSTRD
jgi:hypothetical protein